MRGSSTPFSAVAVRLAYPTRPFRLALFDSLFSARPFRLVLFSSSFSARPFRLAITQGPSLRLERFLLRGREEDVVEDQPIPRRVLVQRQVRRRVADGVLRILGIVAATVRPGALSVIAMDVLHPWCARLFGKHHVARFEHGAIEARRHAVKVSDDRSMVLHEH